MSKKAELSSFEGVRWWKHAGGGADAPAEEANNWLSKRKNIHKSFIKKIPLSPQTSEA